MGVLIRATDGSAARFSSLLRRGAQHEGTGAVGIAVAYVSIHGFTFAKLLFEQNGISDVRMVTDISDCVTHPNALAYARKAGWSVRVVDSESTFHPKYYIGCRQFDASHNIVDPSFVIVSSGNLSHNALQRNAECSFMQTDGAFPSSAKTWSTLWGMGTTVSSSIIADYEKRFAERNKKRRPEDLATLGVADPILTKDAGAPPKKTSPPPDALKANSEKTASVAWAGLESFTGDYTLQVEFPQKAATVLRRLLPSLATGGTINIHCADGAFRSFKFLFYGHNGMFRLNVPNDVPDVEWARIHKKGIAYVEVDESDDVHFAIIRPGSALDDVVRRSVALGTWGRTPTRLFGWY